MGIAGGCDLPMTAMSALTRDVGDPLISFYFLFIQCTLLLPTPAAILNLLPWQGFQRRAVFSSSSYPSRAQRAVKSATESLFSVLFPSSCRICRSLLTNISALPVCGECLEKMVALDGVLCSRCGEKLPGRYLEGEDGPLCPLCQRAAPHFRKAVAYGAYDGALRELLHLFKYQRVRSAAPLLGRLLDRALAGTELPVDLMVIPVPLSRAKQRSRGFNQAEEIARNFVRSRTGASIQVDTAALIRIRETASQTGLTRVQRRSNLRGAFAVADRDKVRGRDILIVDDVMTTGTTAGECARVLLKAGANQVFVATVARAIKEMERELANAASAHLGGPSGHA